VPVDANRIKMFRKLHYGDITDYDKSLGLEDLVCITSLHVVEETIIQDDQNGIISESTHNYHLSNTLIQMSSQSTITTRNLGVSQTQLTSMKRLKVRLIIDNNLKKYYF